MKSREFIKEIISGELRTPNIPDFTNAVYQCDTDGYKVMGTSYKGHYAFGILDDDGQIMSYILTEPEQAGLYPFREIYTMPNYTGKNLAAILFISMKKIGIKLWLRPTEVVSIPARNVISKLVKNGRIKAFKMDNSPINYDELKLMFDKIGETSDELIIESSGFMDWEKRYRKDEILTERWRLRGDEALKNELYPDGDVLYIKEQE